MLALMNINGAILGYENATLTFEGTYGEGIARYIQDPSGQNLAAAEHEQPSPALSHDLLAAKISRRCRSPKKLSAQRADRCLKAHSFSTTKPVSVVISSTATAVVAGPT